MLLSGYGITLDAYINQFHNNVLEMDGRSDIFNPQRNQINMKQNLTIRIKNIKKEGIL